MRYPSSKKGQTWEGKGVMMVTWNAVLLIVTGFHSLYKIFINSFLMTFVSREKSRELTLLAVITKKLKL